MLYECDDGNCSVGHEKCGNRAFTDLQERRTKGGKFRIGVEVIKTADRGYGVRTNRCYDAHQIIVEYTGEIITEDECDRRMREDYKDNEVKLSASTS
jgi:histone-lysine N-methyltransferase ASH1L